MTNFGWDYPPGVSSIPGDFDVTISFTVSFPYTFEKFEDEQPIETMKFNLNIKDYTIVIEKNPDETYTAWITYEDDLDIDPRDMDMLEIEETIIRYLNETYYLNIDPRDDTIEFDIDIHR